MGLTTLCRSSWLALCRIRTQTSRKALARDLNLLNALEIDWINITTIKPTNEHGTIHRREEDLRWPVPLRRGQIHGCHSAAGDGRYDRYAM